MSNKHEIFPQQSFEQQTNGTVFYKEGKLNDFPYAGPGVFESWKYGYDAGKQTFRAENDSKVYERRLVKDQFGNPRWTGWMEVASAEAHGIQAIAVNDKPLQLPNTDGAIKLQITPESIGTYTKQEIWDLVSDKIYEDRYDNYIYVKWGTDEKSGLAYSKPIDVLINAFPDGGEEGKYYLVEPNPGTKGVEEPVTYWIWAEYTIAEGHKKPVGYIDGYYWIPLTDLPEMKAFVSYPAFDEHRFDDTVHVSQEKKDAWDAKPTVDEMNAAIEASNSQALTVAQDAKDTVEEHIRSYGNSDSLHITAVERKNWNEAYNRSKEQAIPLDGLRYVGENGVYVKSFEQYGQSVAKTENLLDQRNLTFKDEATIVTNLYETLFNVYNVSNHILTNVRLEATVHQPRMGDVWITTNGASELFSSADNPWTIDGPNFKSIDLPYATPFDEIHIHCSDNTAPIMMDLRIVVSYYEKETINIGDENLTLNLIGPEIVKTVKEDGTTVIENGPLYNGQPLSELIPDASHTADWGRITGDISLQKDLDLKMADYLSTKLNNAPMDSTLRYDVYRDGLVRSLIQQTDGMQIRAETFQIGNLHNEVEKRQPKGTVVIGDIKEKLRSLTEGGFIPIKAKLSIEYVNCLQNEKLVQLPIHFRTDNDMIPNSPTVASGPFKWDWPGDISKEFDQIILEGNDAESLTNVSLVVQMYKPGNTIIEQPATAEQPSGYNLTIKSKDYNNVVSGTLIETATNKEVHLTGDNWTTVAGNDTLNVEGQLVHKISGQLTEEVNGAKNVILKSDLLENISGAHNYSLSGNSTTTIAGNAIETISGTVTTTVGGDANMVYHSNVENTVEGNLLNCISGGLRETVRGAVIEGYNDSKTTFIEKGYSVSANENISVYSEIINLNGKTTNVGKAKEYDASGEYTVNIYGEEADSRYASRTRFESELMRVTSLIEENSNKDNTEVYNLQSGLAFEISNRKAEDARIREDISGAYATTDAMSGAIETLETKLDAKKMDKSQIYTFDDWYYHFENSSALPSDEYNTRVPSEGLLEFMFQQVNERIDRELGKVADANERWDLTINDSNELATAIEDGTFAASERILFKSGDYVYNGTTLINFENVRFVKGEAPVTVKMTNGSMPNPINFLNTRFETIEMTIGHKVIDTDGAIVMDIDVTRDLAMPINLSEDNVIYRLKIVDDNVDISFDNVVQGKEYTIWVDQPTEQVKNVSFTNHFHNDTLHAIPSKEFGNGCVLEHQAPNSRTIINVTGLNENYANGFVINNIIYGTQIDKNANIKLVLRKTTGKLLGSNVEAEAVVVQNLGEKFTPNSIIEVHSKFINLGWKTAGNIMTITDESGNIRLRSMIGFNEAIGAHDGDYAITKFALDTSLYPTLADSTKEHVLYLDFEVAAAEVSVTLDPIAEQYVSTANRVGFDKTYQPYYDTVNVSFEMNSGYYLHSVSNGNVELSDITQASLPWEFELTSQNNIIITPSWYKNFEIGSWDILNNENYENTEVIDGREMRIEIIPNCSITESERTFFKMAPISVVATQNCTVRQHATYCQSSDHEDGVAHPDNQIVYVTPIAGPIGTEKAVFELIWANQSKTIEFDIERGFSSGGEIKLRDSVESDPNTVLCLSQSNNESPDESKFNEYTIGIDWNVLPSKLAGTWSSTDPKIAEVVSVSGNDVGKLVVKKKGTVKIRFTPTAEPNRFIEKTFNVKAYASDIEIVNNADVTTSQALALNLNWKDFNGTTLVPGTWSDNSVVVTAPVEDGQVARVNVPDRTALKVTFLPVPVEGGMETPAIARVVVTTNQLKLDTTAKPYRESATNLTATIDFNIRPGQYQIGFDKDEHVLSINPSENLTSRGGNIFAEVRFQFENGYVVTEETLAELKEKLCKKSSTGEVVEPVKVLANENGQLKLSVYTPYGNVIIPISTKPVAN
jgi:hypothetical protein